MKYITLQEMNEAIRRNLWKIPRDIDFCLGIPRSGILAASIICEYLNCPLVDVDSFCDGAKPQVVSALESKESMKTINGIFAEVNTLIRESITIYIGESKNFFNSEVTKKLEEIEAYFKKYEENAKENNKFKMNKIFQTEQSKQTILTLLQQYYTLISNSDLVKKELVEDKANFTLEKYPTLESFFKWFITVLPKHFELTVNDLINKKFQIQRDPGPLYKWKDAGIVFTKQHHLLLFDKVDSYKQEDIVKIFETDKITFKKRNDKKRP